MGLLDNLRNVGEQFAAQQQAGAEATLAAQLPAGTVLPRRAYVRLEPRFTDATLQAFLAIVGLAPEDCYGITCTQSNDVTIGWEIYFRHRAEYDAGLARWAELTGGS
jgi:hypothetical protein